jgi:hypothetical protein
MKLLQVHIFNSLNDKPIIALRYPVTKSKSATGFYSRAWRYLKRAYGNLEHVDQRFIRCQIKISKVRFTNRVIVYLPGGASLDYPEDITPLEATIVDKQLEVIQMSKGNK